MPRTTISFRTDTEIRDKLDQIGANMQRDRSFVINEALDGYLAYQREIEAKIKEGLDALDRGDVYTQEEMEEVFAKWRITEA
ncbi:MAG: CopG family ribbon-helix-helix protein [Pikeienuella sp.]